jgi:ribosomal protein S18 acetylase RimI-like enzyme
MNYCFAIELKMDGSPTHIAVANLIRHPGGLLITNVYVPPKFRGKGHGRALLKKVTDAADRDGKKLFLHASSAGAMSDDELEAWYERNGFRRRNALIMEREPFSLNLPNAPREERENIK